MGKKFEDSEERRLENEAYAGFCLAELLADEEAMKAIKYLHARYSMDEIREAWDKTKKPNPINT